MNLSDITTKCWILALFVRDDGERLLLGDGWYDFKDSLQHFQPNTIANDIVELQGTDGQLLAGQVRRSGVQAFDGYIGDATISQVEIEKRRRNFLQFFQTRHLYKVIYIFADGTAIDRKRGYLTEAPSVPEMWQKHPEYHVALNFEDVAYYEYAENAEGEEIYANSAQVKLANILSGGLVWDNDGALSYGLQWGNYQTKSGSFFQIENDLIGAPMELSQLDGNATQDGTPTPDSPQPISTVTGEQVVKVVGKNLLNLEVASIESVYPNNLTYIQSSNDLEITANTTTGAQYVRYALNDFDSQKDYYFSCKAKKIVKGTDGRPRLSVRIWGSSDNTTWTELTPSTEIANPTEGVEYTFGRLITGYSNYRIAFYGNTYTPVTLGEQTQYYDIQLELGSTATAYEPYQEQEFPIDLYEPNLFDITKVISDSNGYLVNNGDGTLSVNGFNRSGNAPYTLGDYCPNLQAGDEVVLNATTDGTRAYIYLSGSNYQWDFGTKRTVTATDLTSRVGFYSTATDTINTISNISIAKPLELVKVGDYKDQPVKVDETWYIRRNTQKVQLTGSLNFQGGDYFSGTTDWVYFYMPKADTTTLFGEENHIIRNDQQGISNMFVPTVSFYGGDATVRSSRFSADGFLRIAFPASLLSDVTSSSTRRTSFKTWLDNNDVYILTYLAEPVDEEITDATLLSQLNFIASLYGGVNNISLVPSAGAQGTMEVKYATILNPGAGYEWDEGEGGGPTNITVAGIANALPIWTITGPAIDPTLTNVTTGKSITWTGTVPTGQKLIINMDEQTATLSGANVYSGISGSWLELAPGTNRLTYIAGGGAEIPSTLEWNGVVG